MARSLATSQPHGLHFPFTLRVLDPCRSATEDAQSPDTPAEEPAEPFGRVPSAGGQESVPLPEGATLDCVLGVRCPSPTAAIFPLYPDVVRDLNMTPERFAVSQSLARQPS